MHGMNVIMDYDIHPMHVAQVCGDGREKG